MTSPVGSDAGAGKGLRHFSSKVCAKVQEKGRTTYNEVADELVRELTVDPKSAGNGSGSDVVMMDEKNIRRRVYDALNVLMAMEIIVKEKKEIIWSGMPRSAGAIARGNKTPPHGPYHQAPAPMGTTTYQQYPPGDAAGASGGTGGGLSPLSPLPHHASLPPARNLNVLAQDVAGRATQLELKISCLEGLATNFSCMRSLVRRNVAAPPVPPDRRIDTPFILLYTLPHPEGKAASGGGTNRTPAIAIGEGGEEVLFDFKVSIIGTRDDEDTP